MESERRLRITGLHHATLICASLERTVPFYRDVLGMKLVREETNPDDPNARHFWFGEGGTGTLISFFEYPHMPEGTQGRGSTHHIALAVEGDDELEGWRSWLRSQGVGSTEVLDRGWFRSIYLRDPDGHILELSTPGAGFDSQDRPT